MLKAQVRAAATSESRMFLKTIGSRPSRAGMPADLANGFANNSRGRQRMQLDSRGERDPYEQARPTTADWSGRPGSCYRSAGPYRASCRSSVGVTSLRWAVRLRAVRSSVYVYVQRGRPIVRVLPARSRSASRITDSPGNS